MNDSKVENTIEEALMAHKSAVWWQEEMNTALLELQRMDLEDPEDLYDNDWSGVDLDNGKERRTLENKIECMLVKGRWEDNNLEKVMKGIELFNLEEKRHIVSEITKRWATEKSQSDAPPSQTH